MKSMTSEVKPATGPQDAAAPTFGALLRLHRRARRLSQEALALDARVSTRHLSCLETGRAQPSRAMVGRLSEALQLVPRERDGLLVHAGFAPEPAAVQLDRAALAALDEAVGRLLTHHEPYPAVVVDRAWNVLRRNGGADRLLTTFVGARKLPPHVATNLVRLTLHPAGLKPSVLNWNEVAASLFERVERAANERPTDARILALRDELRVIPNPPGHAMAGSWAAPFGTLVLRRKALRLTFFSMLTTVGTPLDTTADELTVESLFPADTATDAWLRHAPSRTPKA